MVSQRAGRDRGHLGRRHRAVGQRCSGHGACASCALPTAPVASIGAVMLPAAMLLEEMVPVSWLAETVPVTVAAVAALLAVTAVPALGA